MKLARHVLLGVAVLVLAVVATAGTMLLGAWAAGKPIAEDHPVLMEK